MMTFVERNYSYPSLSWGKNLSLKVHADRLTVSGEVLLLQEDADVAPDLFRSYRNAVRPFGPQKRQGKNSPHIQFANAEDDEQLIEFVRQFGPVVVKSFANEEHVIGTDYPFDFNRTKQVWIAEQELRELRNERQIYRAALVLVSELERQHKADIQVIQKCVRDIADNISDWPMQWRREQRFRTGGKCYFDKPMWTFQEENVRHLETWRYYATHVVAGELSGFGGPDPIHAGHNVVCELVNAFTPHIYIWGETPVEAPGWDLAGGIRPLLYYILRREYLQAGGIAVCRNTDCRELFEIERAGQEFCGDECSRHQRQREYWIRRGKKLRKRRLKSADQMRVKELDRQSKRKK